MWSIACKNFAKPQTFNLCRCFADRKLLPNDEKKMLEFNQHLELQSNQAPQLCEPVNLSNCSESITRLTYPWYSNEMLGNIAQEPYKPYGTIGCLCATRRYFWNNSPNPEGFVTYGPVNTRIYDAYQDQFLNNRWNLHTCEDRVNPNHHHHHKVVASTKCPKCGNETCKCGENCKCEKGNKCTCKSESSTVCGEEKSKCCRHEEKSCICKDDTNEKCCKDDKKEKCCKNKPQEKCGEEKKNCGCKKESV